MNSIMKFATLETTLERLKSEYGEKNIRKENEGYSVRIVGARDGLRLYVPEMVDLVQYDRRLDLRKGFEIPELESMLKKTSKMWEVGFLFCYRAIRSSEIIGKRRIETCNVTLCAPEDSTYVIVIPHFQDKGYCMAVYSPAIFCCKIGSSELDMGRRSYSIIKMGSLRSAKARVIPEVVDVEDRANGIRQGVIKIASSYLGVEMKCES